MFCLDMRFCHQKSFFVFNLEAELYIGLHSSIISRALNVSVGIAQVIRFKSLQEKQEWYDKANKVMLLNE
jgi:hypothetical protein